ncbi:MAG: four helix bundle protein [Patescibacteria group bacterium]
MEKSGKGYHKLIVWQRARELVKIVYEHTDAFPKAEEFGLKGQIRRASVSVVLNIVEGYRRSSRKDYIHFLTIANGSLSETEAAMELSVDLKYLTEANYEILEKKRGEVAYLLYQLIKSLKAK